MPEREAERVEEAVAWVLQAAALAGLCEEHQACD